MRTQALDDNGGNAEPNEMLSDRRSRQKLSAEKKSLHEQILEFEHGIIAEALAAAGGRVCKAATALGPTHQGLCYIINYRHKDLLTARTPIRIRRKSLIPKDKHRHRHK